MDNPFCLPAKSGGGEYRLPPCGTHPGVLVGMLDIGTHEEEFQGRSYMARKILLVWEIVVSGERFFISRDYTMSLHSRSTLRKLLESWRGKPYADGEEPDLSKTLGQPCQVLIMHKEARSGNTYARVETCLPRHRADEAVTPSHPLLLWSVCEGRPAPSHEWLPYLRGRPLGHVIYECQEWRSKASTPDQPARQANQDPDTIPF